MLPVGKSQMKIKSLLFITWDGPQTSYMEGLFMPIFNEIAKREAVNFHVIQFTWAYAQKTAAVKKTAQSLGIQYTAFPILKKPVASLGSLITLFTSSSKIEKYILEHHIDTVMPRSNFPAFMVNNIKNRNFKIIFDADGLPIEERVDFAGLKKDSLQYRWMKSIETKMLKRADAVVTRSQRSIDIHLQQIGEKYRDKFSVVYNGRNANFFQNSVASRQQSRKQLGINNDELLFVYCGSLGDQYCWEEMLTIVSEYQKIAPAKFLVLTGNTAFALSKLSAEQQKIVFVKSVTFTEVPFWLSAADIAFGLRQPSFSMQGVAPIKLGEYLLMNIPTIASIGIGDSEEILQHFEDCFLFDHKANQSLQQNEIMSWLVQIKDATQINTREEALKYFSLDAAAESYCSAFKNI